MKIFYEETCQSNIYPQVGIIGLSAANTSPNVSFAAELMRSVSELQHFWREAVFPTACLHGECSLVSSFAPMFPSATQKLFDLARTKRIEELFLLQRVYLLAA